MTDIPIIFSAPMVRALLAGQKTMTRRLAWRLARKGEKTGKGSRLSYVLNPGTKVGTVTAHYRPTPWQRVKVGDRLWVRENALYWLHNTGEFVNNKSKVAAYQADGYQLEPREVWSPSIHMPRWASRITIVITAAKVEPLQAISDADAKAEGIVEDDGSEPDIWYVPGAAKAGWKIQMANRPAPVFKSLWSALHGTESWESNPEVVALAYRVILANIDSDEMKAA